MPKRLVIVESPSKAKTIRRYLGAGYSVKASVGHVRDLPPKSLGVDIDEAFAPTYVTIRGKETVLKELRKAASSATEIYLATDPDREGEAIAWHLCEGAGLDRAKTHRVSFNQVTKAAVREAIDHPRDVDVNLVDAQQARRVLDRLVGYQISPLLSKAVRGGNPTRRPLSAGRVQSVALRLVVEREREIRAFVAVEYWSIEADLRKQTGDRSEFSARLHKIRGKDPELGSQEVVDPILATLRSATYRVAKVTHGKRRQKPPAPYVTSTLQADANSKLSLSPRRTMRLAQQLYEGIDLEGERVGLITYMRSDSTHVAPEAQQEAKQLITEHWGTDYLPAKPPIYQRKAANAQEAHEAIRPTSVQRTPESLGGHLDRSQLRLYRLIWSRFLASQMKPAIYATMRVDIAAATDYLFRATSQKLVFPGFLVAYGEPDQDKEQELPDLAQGEIVDLRKLIPEQHFTQPPPRFSEATLIREMEANGVGRPSTYASIVSVIQDRKYVVKEKRRLVPTDLGMVVSDSLVATFPDIMDVSYTAGMERQLDEVAVGTVAYAAMMQGFWDVFHPALEAAANTMPAAVSTALLADLPDNLAKSCPRCGQPLVVRISNSGRFMGCTGYPDCRYVLDLSDPANPRESPEQKEEYAEGVVCELCGGRMRIIRKSKAPFMGCENYPKCKFTKPILSNRIVALARDTACPECGHTPLEPKSGRYGEYLFCPACKKNISLRKLGMSKREMINTPCPECGHQPIESRSGRYGPYYHCPECGSNISHKKLADAQKAAD